MSKNFGPVWVIAEQDDCKAEIVSLQLLGKARELADELGVACEAVLCGHAIAETARDLVRAGADRVYLGDAPALETYQPVLYADLICSLAERHGPEIILIGSTFMGRELAPIVAARLKTGLAAHCTGLRHDKDKNLEQQVPAYGGLMSIVCPKTRPQMATVARGVFKTPEPDGGREGEIIPVATPEAADLPVRTLEIVREKSAGLQLEEARVIVTGGAGACGPEGWKTIRELADTLEAALGCTRPVVDEGWAPKDTMIGQSGKMVCPRIYIGIGLSGEQQHMVGISGADLMVAVNNDPKSPVFQQVDLGIVEDCHSFLPLLIAKIKNFRDARLGCRPTD
ncbi:MAG: electron transfer flavoprotein subunit alpha/FixB family protein [Syntrophobacteraceae bacterium]